MLENALVDTGRPLDLSIPEWLKAQGDPGTYIVQARGPIDDGFRAVLAAAGAGIVGYIPNNAYLVRASAAVAKELEGQSQAVLAYEPYYKLQGSLLGQAVEQRALGAGSELNVVVFEDAREETHQALEQLGAQVVSESPSPFGPVLRVRFESSAFSLQPSALSLVAGLSGVESVEVASERKPANDLSRARVGVAADSVTQTNYLGLSGSNVVVAVNDTGVDGGHPDLSPRVFGSALTDVNGHGTHVAGIIGSSGGQSQTVSNAAGSTMPATTNQFRGMAPGARLYSLLAVSSGGLSDFDLQEAAARTNALISNNSWNYAGNSYDIAAASYDAAVRDALPEVSGSQPVLFVFSAGDGGNGNDNGLSGQAESIQSPGTAKNGITVGALEQARGITNVVHPDVTDTNAETQPWLGRTDSDDEVAAFSARGNVGIGTEGEFGRFKPDVVAPGTFVVSTRVGAVGQGGVLQPDQLSRQHVPEPGGADQRAEPVCDFRSGQRGGVEHQRVHGGAGGRFADLPEGRGFSDEGRFRGEQHGVAARRSRALTTGTTWFYSIGNPTNRALLYDVVTELVTTNDNGDYFQVLSNLNEGLGPYYRYESGTSMSAADVSGVLALMQEFFESRLQMRPSPALLKAMLINGARPANNFSTIFRCANRSITRAGAW